MIHVIFGAKCQGTISDVHVARRISLMQELSDAQRKHTFESLHFDDWSFGWSPDNYLVGIIHESLSWGKSYFTNTYFPEISLKIIAFGGEIRHIMTSL